MERVRDSDGNELGRDHHNPILDTRRYRVRFDDGDVAELTANVVAEAMYAQYDSDGNNTSYLIQSLITKDLRMPFHYQIRKLLRMGKRTPEGVRQDGSCAVSGRMVQLHGRSLLC